MANNQARCRNRRTGGTFPPRSRCMLQCRLSFCICQLRMTRMFPTLLFLLHRNSRPPPPSPEYTQRTKSHTKRRKAACGTPGARLYTRGNTWDLFICLYCKITFKRAPCRGAQSQAWFGHYKYRHTGPREHRSNTHEGACSSNKHTPPATEACKSGSASWSA